MEPKCIQGNALKDSYNAYIICGGTTTLRKTCPANYQCYFDGTNYGCCPTQGMLQLLSLVTNMPTTSRRMLFYMQITRKPKIWEEVMSKTYDYQITSYGTPLSQIFVSKNNLHLKKCPSLRGGHARFRTQLRRLEMLVEGGGIQEKTINGKRSILLRDTLQNSPSYFPLIHPLDHRIHHVSPLGC